MEELSFFTSKEAKKNRSKHIKYSTETYFTSSMGDIALFSVTPLKEENKPVKKIWILVVAVGEYLIPNARLPGIHLDVDNFKTLFTSDNLVSKNVNIIELINKDATMLSIEKAIQEITLKINKEDIFAFYYTGHGIQVPNSQGKINTAIVPYDMLIKSRNNKKYLENYIDVPDLVKKISEIQARAKIIILDI